MVDSTIVDVGVPVHVLDHGGTGPLLVLIHGLGGSATNWLAAGHGLAENHHVVALDLAGFGITPPHGRNASVESNAGLVVDLIHRLDEPSATLVGNSMGGLVAMLAAVDAPHVVDALVLVNPALPVSSWRQANAEVVVKLIGPLIPGLGAPAIRIYRSAKSPEKETAATLRMVTADPATVSPIMKEAMVETNRIRRELDWTVPSFLEADRSIARYVLNRRAYRKLLHRITPPTLLIHGTEDRLVSLDSARWAASQRPDWKLEVLDGVGHIPMVEVPERFVSVVTTWLEGIDLGAAR